MQVNVTRHFAKFNVAMFCERRNFAKSTEVEIALYSTSRPYNLNAAVRESTFHKDLVKFKEQIGQHDGCAAQKLDEPA